MDTLTLEEIGQLHLLFRRYRSHQGMGSWFRGQGNVAWSLLPKAGRSGYLLPANRDLGRFYEWRQQAVAYGTPPDEWMEELALAQHHGLATRLLDWTKNPLVAAYFSMIVEPDADGAIYILEPLEDFVNSDVSEEQVKNFEGVACYLPRSISPRLLNQGGMFTIHCPPDRRIAVSSSRFDDERMNLKQIVIPAKLKVELRNMLMDYGIDHARLFPDFDGLSVQNNMDTEDMVTRSQR